VHFFEMLLGFYLLRNFKNEENDSLFAFRILLVLSVSPLCHAR